MATKIVSILPAGTNSHEETAENVGAIATDFISDGVVGSITNTSGVAPSTGAFAVNAQGTPDMTVAVTGGVAWVAGTPTAGNSQRFRVYMSSSENATIAANSTGGTRYDYIYIKLDSAKLANPNLAADDVATLVVSRSTSSTTDDGTPPTYGYNIAKVTVANGASSITNANIADVRAQSSMNSVVNDGWTPATGTWTYASATTITVPSGATSKYSVGDKVKLVQSGTTKYFYITTVASTLLTITGGSDYTLANSTISSPYTSNAATPLGFPQYFSYTPTWTNLTVGSATQLWRFTVKGKSVHVYGHINLSSSTVGTGPVFTTPTTLSSNYQVGSFAHPLGHAIYNDAGVQQYVGAVWTYSTNTQVQPIVIQPSGSYVLPSGLAASIPFAFGNGDRLVFDFMYEMV